MDGPRVSRRRRRHNKSSITSFNWGRAVRKEAFLFKTTVNSFQLGGTVLCLPVDADTFRFQFSLSEIALQPFPYCIMDLFLITEKKA